MESFLGGSWEEGSHVCIENESKGVRKIVLNKSIVR